MEKKMEQIEKFVASLEKQQIDGQCEVIVLQGGEQDLTTFNNLSGNNNCTCEYNSIICLNFKPGCGK